MAQFPIINGREYSHSSVRVILLGKEYYSVKSVDYKTTKTKGRVFGNGQGQIGKTRGNKENSGSIEILRREFEQMTTDIMAVVGAGGGFGDLDFDVKVMYRDTGMPPVLDEILACNIDEADLNSAQGTDAEYVKLTLHPLKIKLNGKEI